MNIGEFKKLLSVFKDDVELFITTSPDDFYTPVEIKNVSLIPASHCERYGLEQCKLLLTAFIPYKEGKP